MYGVRGPREHFLLRMAACVPLLFFGYASLRTRGEANWPSAAYIAACVGVAGMRPLWQRAAAFSGLAVVLVVGSHLLFPVLHFRRDTALWRTHGWSVLRELATPQRLFPEQAPDNVAAVYAPNYQLASQVAYHARRFTKTGAPARFSQYDLWADPDVTPGQDVLWVSEGGPPPPEDLASRFTALEGPGGALRRLSWTPVCTPSRCGGCERESPEFRQRGPPRPSAHGPRRAPRGGPGGPRP